MKAQHSDFTWYSSLSTKAKLPPRCPIASAELCPRYYASIWLLGNAGITTNVSAEDKIRLDRKWHPFKPTIAEEEPGIGRADGKFHSISHFCPEVSEMVFGLFASGLCCFADEIDRNSAYERLSAEGADISDPRRSFSTITSCHYTECREYSIFSEMTSRSSVKTKARSVRTGLGPKIRWQVMARDSFTCRYCGKRPPDVALEVDHMISVVDGGKNDLDNLITACLECNRGKGASSLPTKA